MFDVTRGRRIPSRKKRGRFFLSNCLSELATRGGKIKAGPLLTRQKQDFKKKKEKKIILTP